jgi:hypothetical protein
MQEINRLVADTGNNFIYRTIRSYERILSVSIVRGATADAKAIRSRRRTGCDFTVYHCVSLVGGLVSW